MPFGYSLPVLFWLLMVLLHLVAWGCDDGIPEAPSHLSVEPSSEVGSLRVIAVAWKDNAINEENYVVERASSPDGPWQVVVVRPSHWGKGRFVVAFDQALGSGGSYWYRAYACNGRGHSSYSNVVVIQVLIEPDFRPFEAPFLNGSC